MAKTPGALPPEAPTTPPQQAQPVAPGTGSAVRRVRTAEGSRFFGIPVGAVITDTTDTQRGMARQMVSTTKLTSLQRQFQTAKATGDVSLMHDLQDQFSMAVKEYVANGGQMPDVIKTLTGDRGRMSKDIIKESDPGRQAPVLEAPIKPETPAAPDVPAPDVPTPDATTPPEAPAPPEAVTPPASGAVPAPDASTSAPFGADAGAAAGPAV